MYRVKDQVNVELIQFRYVSQKVRVGSVSGIRSKLIHYYYLLALAVVLHYTIPLPTVGNQSHGCRF